MCVVDRRRFLRQGVITAAALSTGGVGSAAGDLLPLFVRNDLWERYLNKEGP